MIAFVQPFGLRADGGGSRILRALLASEHPPILSINTGPSATPAYLGIEEIHLPLRPSFGRLERTRLHRALGVLDEVFRSRFEDRLRRILQEHQVKLIHIIPHFYDIVPVFRVTAELDIPFFLSVHDDIEYTAKVHPLVGKIVKTVDRSWRDAKGIFAISDQMAHEYSRRFGTREYQIVTDGLASVAETPQSSPPARLHVYFMGLFHLNYGANFRALLDALKIVRNLHPDWDVSLTCRCGTASVPLTPDDVPVRVLPFAPENEVARDILSADLLYQPLPFQPSAAGFSRFSMSTKMVTYLGSGLPILYHGPRDAAACELLTLHDAAVTCTTLDAEIIAKQLDEAASKRGLIVNNALALARSQFMLADQQRRFWGTITAAL